MSLDVYLMSEPYPSCDRSDDVLYWANITHNLNRMAEAAEIYKALWRPDEVGVELASDLIPVLTEGIKNLKSNPEYYKEFNASNGWGLYEHFVPFVEKYLEACLKHPEAYVRVSR